MPSSSFAPISTPSSLQYSYNIQNIETQPYNKQYISHQTYSTYENNEIKINGHDDVVSSVGKEKNTITVEDETKNEKDHELILNFNKKFLKRDKNGANIINSNYSEILTKSTINLLKKLNSTNYKKKLKKKKYYNRNPRSIESIVKGSSSSIHHAPPHQLPPPPQTLSSVVAPSSITPTSTSSVSTTFTSIPQTLPVESATATISSKTTLTTSNLPIIPTISASTIASTNTATSSQASIIPVIPSPPPSFPSKPILIPSNEHLLSFSSPSEALPLLSTLDENKTNKNNYNGDNKKSQSDISNSELRNSHNNKHNINEIILNSQNENSNNNNNNLTNLLVSEMEDQIRSNPSLQDEQIIILTDDGAIPEPLPQPAAIFADESDDYIAEEPKALPLRPIIRGPDEDLHQGEVTIVYVEQHSSVKLNCEVDLDISSSIWFKDEHVSLIIYIK